MSLAFFISASLVYAAPVGNIAIPSVLKKGLVTKDKESQYAIVVSSENDINFDRKLKDKEGECQYNFFGGKFGVMFVDRFIAYGVLGSAEAKHNYKFTGKMLSQLKWDTDYDLAWGAGGTIMAYETKLKELGNGILRVGFDGRYMQSHLDVENMSSAKFELDDWQVAAALSLQIGNFIPYVGGKYSDVTGEAKTTIAGVEYKKDFEADDNFGVFCGADYIVDDSIAINCEGRFIDETAISAGVTVRY
jgi:hypothetical protein